jgi:Ni/Fe-hydrogenase subunit HybB-like protein
MPSDIARGAGPVTSPFIAPGTSYERVAHDIAAIAFAHPGWRRWWLSFTAALALVGMLAILLLVLFWQGVGIWGNNIPVTWALDIVGYDWWMGVACGALLISALLLLLGVEWRSALNRLTETVALLAACAGAIYPIIHLGRPWFFYWNLPYPNRLLLWPQFRSPLYWDAVDILSFLTVALTFWYVGMLPDLATLRDRAAEQARAGGRGALLRAQLYGIAALGWRGAAVHWQRWTRAYRILALLGVVVVVTLQSGAAVMFAGTVEPGWHDTMQPVAFLAAALFAGVGVVAALAVVMRAVFALHGLITDRHLDILGRLLLALGLLNLYCDMVEFFMVGLSGGAYERALMYRRVAGPHAWAFWVIIGCALVPVQLFWIGRLRRAPVLLFVIGVLVAIGMWADHFMVIVDTLQHDFLPSSDRPYGMDAWAAATFAGSVGLFFALLLLALRYLPVISILEMRHLARIAEPPFRRGPPPVAEGSAPLWGVAAEFATAAAMTAALVALRAQGMRRLDAFMPVPVPAVEQAMALRRAPMADFAIAGTAFGAVFMFGMASYATVFDYVFDIGGRPRFSWPSFVIPGVAFATLTGALATALALLVLNRLPRLNHPAFNIPGFGSATQDRFFVVVEARAEGFDVAAAEQALAALPDPPLAIAVVPR